MNPTLTTGLSGMSWTANQPRGKLLHLMRYCCDSDYEERDSGYDYGTSIQGYVHISAGSV